MILVPLGAAKLWPMPIILPSTTSIEPLVMSGPATGCTVAPRIRKLSAVPAASGMASAKIQTIDFMRASGSSVEQLYDAVLFPFRTTLSCALRGLHARSEEHTSELQS